MTPITITHRAMYIPHNGWSRTFSPVAHIQREVAKHFAVPLRSLTNREGSKEAVKARWVAMFLARNMLGKGPTEIGRRFLRDHSTVTHGIKRVAASPAMLRDVDAIRARLG